jgi:SagB-type dehydrogenase family enzyme
MGNKRDILKQIYSSDFVFNQQSIYSSVIGIENPKTIEQGLLFSNVEFISQTYLRNFENTSRLGAVLSTGEYMSNSSNIAALYQQDLKEDISDCIHLPKARKCKISLLQCLKNRISSRDFRDTAISLIELSDLLFYSSSVLHAPEKKLMNKINVNFFRRTYPSGGGMYSIDIYLAIYNVKGLNKGIYKYQPISHSLIYVKDIETLDKFVITARYNLQTGKYDNIENFLPSVVFIFTNNFTRPRIKYGELSLLLALVDCGCLLQNFSLLAAGLSLNFCIWAGYKKSSIENVLNLDGISNHVIMTALLGGKNA